MCSMQFTHAQGFYVFVVISIITCVAFEEVNGAVVNATAASADVSAAASPTAKTPATANLEDETFISHPPPHYLTNIEISALFAKLQELYPNLATKYSIGKTLKGRDMYALALKAHNKDGVKNGDLLRPLVKLTANIQGDEALGRQIVIFLAQYLTANYEKLPEVQRILNNTEIHLVPSLNPDGYEASQGPLSSVLCFKPNNTLIAKSSSDS